MQTFSQYVEGRLFRNNNATILGNNYDQLIDPQDIIHQSINQLGWQITFVDWTKNNLHALLKRFPTFEDWRAGVLRQAGDLNTMRLRHFLTDGMAKFAHPKMLSNFFKPLLQGKTPDEIIRISYDNLQKLSNIHVNQTIVARDLDLVNRAIIALHSIGIRKFNRIPIVIVYIDAETKGGGAYIQEGHQKIFIYLPYDGSTSVKKTLRVVCHEIGHHVYSSLSSTDRAKIYELAQQYQGLRPYTQLKPNHVVTAQRNGEEWFADYVYGIAIGPNRFSARQEPALSPVRKIFANQKVVGRKND